MLRWLYRLLEQVSKGGRARAYMPPIVNHLDPDSIKSFMMQWNQDYPIDRWWREKHRIPFNSPQHRDMLFTSIRFEWEEDHLYSKFRNEEEYIPNKGDFIKKSVKDERTEEQQLEEFIQEESGFDYSQYDD